MTVSPFEIAVLDSSGNRLGDGPITDVESVSISRHLDKIGSATITVSANALRTDLITPSGQLDIWDERDGYLGRFYFNEDSIKFDKGRGNFRIQLEDAMTELRREFVGFRRNYYLQTVEYVLTDLINIVASLGWTLDVEPNIGNTSVNYEGESIFAAIDVLRDRWDRHLRISGTKTLEFGAFGNDSEVVLLNLEGQQQADLNAFGFNVALVDQIERKRDASDIFNVIYPLGAGQGLAQLTIEDAVGGTYAVQSSTNADGSLAYYISNATSVATYGRRVRVVTFPQIRPLSNTDDDIQRARNALKLAAEAYIARHLVEKTTYDVSVRKFPPAVQVGDTVRLRYRGADRRGVILDVDADFYVMDITSRRTARGDRSTQLTLSNVLARRTSDRDVLTDVVKDVRALKLHVQPQTWWSENTYVRYVYGTSIPDSEFNAVFKIELDEQVTDVHKVLIRFKTRPLEAYVQTFINFTTNSVYEIAGRLVDDHYPVRIRLLIDGVDVTTDYGGPWAMDVDGPIDVSLNITDTLRASAGGLRNDHTIEISSAYEIGNAFGAGDPAYPAYRPSPVNAPNPSVTSKGLVEMNIRIQGTAMAIVAE